MIYEYKGFGNCESKCKIEVHSNIVIATELDDNTGTSITNYAETLATMICKQFSILPEELIWIEHYPKDSYSLETYSLVKFDIDKNRFSNPKWSYLSNTELEGLIKKLAGRL